MPALVPVLVPALVPVLVPALVPALVHEVPTASGREAVGTETKVERPRRSCAINRYVSENYVLDTETAPTPALAHEQRKSKFGRSRSLSVTSNRRSGIGSGPAKNPSILPFLKPMGASTKGSERKQNEVLLKPKVAAVEPCFEPKDLEEAIVSQTHMQDFFPKN